MKNGVKAWSFSAWKLYTQCPRKFKYLRIKKMPEPKSPHLEKGIHWHKQAELFIKRVIEFPQELEKFDAEFRMLQDLHKNKGDGILVEEELAFSKTWEPTGWFDYNTWCRIKMDVICIHETLGKIIDFKTGKVGDDYDDQQELYALGLFKEFEGLEEVVTELWFLEHGVVKPEKPMAFYASQEKELQEKWEHKVIPMFNDTEFAPNPSNLCRFCHFRKSNGGPCEFA